MQNFTAEKPNQRWVSDITYTATAEGWLYVAAILDLFSRRIVGLSMGERLTTPLIRNALHQAIIHRKPEPGLLYHSDQGCEYTSHDFQEDLALNQMLCSRSGTGNCYDNGVPRIIYL
jgi:putative transposase